MPSMDHPYDDFAKKVGKGALTSSGSTTVEHPVPRRAQRADIRHVPDPARTSERGLLGLLGRIAAVVCLIEIYAHAPEGGELRACVSKHFAHWEAYVRGLRLENRKRKRTGQDPEPVIHPMLWILAVTVSEPMLRKLKVRTKSGWPSGVYFHGDDLYRVGIVVANKLPRDRSTLLVRFLVAGPLLADAVADLVALPEDAIERGLVEGDLVDLGRVLEAKASRTPQEEEIGAMIQGTFTIARKMGREEGRDEGRREGRDEGRREGRDEGRREGRDEGRREGRAEEAARAVLTALRVRGIAVADTVRERILAQKDPSLLERWLEKAIVAASIHEVLGEPS